MNTNLIKDALHNLSLYENNNKHMTFAQEQYYRGLIVGMITILMSSEKRDYETAHSIILNNLPYAHVTLKGLID